MIVFQYGQAEVAYLREQDRWLGQAIERIGRIERPVIPDLFTALISSIVHQQISNKAAATVWSRVVERIGPILPEAVAATPVEDIQQCGMSLRKAGYIKSIARAVVRAQIHPREAPLHINDAAPGLTAARPVSLRDLATGRRRNWYPGAAVRLDPASAVARFFLVEQA